MFRTFFRIFTILAFIFIFILAYLSFFGFKTDRFNEFIKTQIIKEDERLNIDIKNIFIKLNIKETSLSLNSKDIDIFILKEKQKIANVDILIDALSLITGENKIKKIIINSDRNEISNLLNFIRIYKINIPVLYLQNSVKRGQIIYNATINLKNNNFDQIELKGKINNTELNILDKQKYENISLDFNFKNNNLKISNLKFKYKNLNFSSKKIETIIGDKIISFKGDLKNLFNSALLSNLLSRDIKKYIDEEVLLSANSIFEFEINKKFKIKKYKFKSKVRFQDLIINLKNINAKKYLKGFDKKLLLSEGFLDFNINSKKQISIKFNSNYILNKKQKPKEISINYSMDGSNELYDLNIDLIENEINFNQINFNKKKGEEFNLNLILTKKKNLYRIKKLELFNSKNKFKINNFKLSKNFKIIDFDSLNANYFNINGFNNYISITKKKNKIKITSPSFDISSDIEKSLKDTKDANIFKIFENFNSQISLNIKLARLDDNYYFNNFNGIVEIKNSKINNVNLSAKFKRGGIFNYTKDKLDGSKVTIVYSDHAKPFVKKFDFIKGFEDGKLDYTSTQFKNNTEKSELRIYDFKLKDMPVLTKLLSLASLQGIADLATGEGIRFNEFEMFFENSKNLIKINEIYALGPAISILMEGYVEKNKLVSLRGTLVPATTINKNIAKIPLLGELLVGDKSGEGVFGVSFKIKGPPDKLETKVNPIKTLTPRFITRTLDKLKKSN